MEEVVEVVVNLLARQTWKSRLVGGELQRMVGRWWVCRWLGMEQNTALILGLNAMQCAKDWAASLQKEKSEQTNDNNSEVGTLSSTLSMFKLHAHKTWFYENLNFDFSIVVLDFGWMGNFLKCGHTFYRPEKGENTPQKFGDKLSFVAQNGIPSFPSLSVK